jgi:hypothetical protein
VPFVTHSGFQIFPGFAGINYRYFSVREIVTRRMRSEGNAPKNGESSSCFSRHDNAPAHRSVLVKDFVTTNNVATLEHPPYSPDLPPANFYCSLDLNHNWRETAFAMLQISLGMRRRSWKGFHKMAFRNISNAFTVAGRSVYLHKGAI